MAENNPRAPDLSASSLEELRRALRDPDSYVRSAAAHALGRRREPAAVDVLIEELKAEDWKSRRNAAHALGVARDPRAVEALIWLLHDRYQTVRQRAVVALGQLRDARAVTAIVDALVDGRVDREGVTALKRFGRIALNPILAALRDRRERANGNLIWALANIKDRQIIGPLAEALMWPGVGMADLIGRTLSAWGKEEMRAAVEPHFPTTLAQARERVALIFACSYCADAALASRLVLLLEADEDPQLFGEHRQLYNAIVQVLDSLEPTSHFRGTSLVIEILRNPFSRPLARAAAALVLPMHHANNALPVLAMAAADETPIVRIAARWGLQALERYLDVGVDG